MFTPIPSCPTSLSPEEPGGLTHRATQAWRKHILAGEEVEGRDVRSDFVEPRQRPGHRPSVSSGASLSRAWKLPCPNTFT